MQEMLLTFCFKDFYILFYIYFQVFRFVFLFTNRWSLQSRQSDDYRWSNEQIKVKDVKQQKGHKTASK